MCCQHKIYDIIKEKFEQFLREWVGLTKGRFMSFTIQDMMLTAETRYEMKFLAGKNGWSNSISWVHLLEDTTIIQNFWGKELAVTTGLGFPEKEDWMHLAQQLNRYHASGLVINVGQYIYEVPEELKHTVMKMTFRY